MQLEEVGRSQYDEEDHTEESGESHEADDRAGDGPVAQTSREPSRAGQEISCDEKKRHDLYGYYPNTNTCISRNVNQSQKQSMNKTHESSKASI